MYQAVDCLSFIYLFIHLFIYLFIIIINNLFIYSFIVCCFICFYVLSRARYPSSHACTSSAVFIGFMYILKICSFIHLFNPPPPPLGLGGLKLEYSPRIPMRLEWGGFSK